MGDLFPTVFPPYSELWRANQLRMKNFQEYTEREANRVQSVNRKSIEPLLLMNSLGLFTTDSQDGVYSSDLNPKAVNGSAIENNSGSLAIKSTLIEFSYIYGFLPKRLYEKLTDKLENIKDIYVYNLSLGQNILWHPVIELLQYNNRRLDIEVYDKQEMPNMDKMLVEEMLDRLTEVDENSYGGGVEALYEIHDVIDDWVPIRIMDSRAGHRAFLPDGLFTIVNQVLEESLKELLSQAAKKGGMHRRRHRSTHKRRSKKRHTRKNQRRVV